MFVIDYFCYTINAVVVRGVCYHSARLPKILCLQELICCEINSEIKPLKTKHNLFYIRTQGVLHSKHSPYRLPKTNHTMMYKVELVYSEMYTIK